MREAEQTKGLSLLEHGAQVFAHYTRFLHGDIESSCLKDCLPVLIRTSDSHHSKPLIFLYQLFHDCGKLETRIEDESGVHFPDHAASSARLWRASHGTDASMQTIARLMENDMFLHTCSADDLDSFKETTLLPTLFLTAYAEIYANADMFGGRESISFKSKRKHLDRRLKRYMNTLIRNNM